MTVLFRADASEGIGSGHLMRCMALAQLLRRRGCRVVFLCATIPDHLQSRLGKEGIELFSMRCRSGSEEDGDIVRAFAVENDADWLVIDGYHFLSDWFHRHGGIRLYKMMAIIDSGQAAHCPVDLIVNPCAEASVENYESIPRSVKVLSGAKYLMLRHEFDDILDVEVPRRRRVLVTVGGGDSAGLAGRLTKWLAKGVPGIHIRTILGGNGSCEDELRALAIESGIDVELVIDAQNMAEMIAWCDIGVTAAGSTTWEFCRLGRPMVHLIVASNQVPVAASVYRKGASINLGWGLSVVSQDVCRAASALLDSAELYDKCASAGKQLVDGFGTRRIAALMQGTTLRIRKATRNDAEFLYRLASDRDTRKMSFTTTSFSFAEHTRWLADALNAPLMSLLIGLTKAGERIGVVRFDRRSGLPEISVTIAPEMRGRGLAGAFITRCTTDFVREACVDSILARIKESNSGSIKAFMTAGYDVAERSPQGIVSLMYYPRKRY